MIRSASLREWSDTEAQRLVLPFHFNEIDEDILGAKPNSLSQSIRHGLVECLLLVGGPPLAQRHLDNE